MFLTYGFGDLHDSSKQENFLSAEKTGQAVQGFSHYGI